MRKNFDVISCQTDELIETVDDATLTLYRAAPELLAALHLCHEQLSIWVADEDEQSACDKEALDAAVAAIAKAEGAL